ncbi:MAG: NAD-dependent epimerase/dehydratase family protein [Candidatus Sungiibacteriota bacterium]|uniref:NAD-dependent epimerase/dehydratase family protein n=1 Tax=Candidatus Sungiibacteriota bacterium TaxID=2750080 RepID=A0A7T5RJF5_9BACT|nr:MAG: NAD-dependent epimerase/dehydratase family protein [Candidatus Sungbacteria bacterium]
MSTIKVIVTGGAGFIGSHLVDALIEKGYEVYALDTFLAGKREHLNPAAILHEADIRDFDNLVKIFQGARYVFHTAALPRVQPSIQDPRTTHDINVNGTLNVLVAARDAGIKRVIYSASSSAYGNQEKLPLREDMGACPLSPYGMQKYIGELYCRLFSEIYALETVALRYFNVYGPRASTQGAYALVIGRFLEQRKQGESLTIVPDGMQSRDFTHVRDVVRANILAAESPKVGRGETINIGGGKDRTVLEIADLIGGPRVFIEPRLEPKHTLADITKARELLGWSPEVNFEDGIQELKNLYGIR